MFARPRSLWIFSLVLGILPLAWLFFDVLNHRLGANPIQALHFRLGDWTLRFLCLTLAITPLQLITHWRGLSDFRQLFGLYTFFYATLHVLGYLALDQAFAWNLIASDLLESPYVWFGLLAYLILFSLAITSPKAAKRMMGRNWKKLHRLIYLAAAAALIHYFWQIKGNFADPAFYALAILLLMTFRVRNWLR